MWATLSYLTDNLEGTGMQLIMQLSRAKSSTALFQMNSCSSLEHSILLPIWHYWVEFEISDIQSRHHSWLVCNLQPNVGIRFIDLLSHWLIVWNQQSLLIPAVIPAGKKLSFVISEWNVRYCHCLGDMRNLKISFKTDRAMLGKQIYISKL